jgi:magnesium transporter
MRRQVILFQGVHGPMSEVVGKVTHLELPCVDENAKPYFRDVLDHVKRVETMIAGLRDVITSVFEASNLLEQQQRQGTIARQLAVRLKDSSSAGVATVLRDRNVPLIVCSGTSII